MAFPPKVPGFTVFLSLGGSDTLVGTSLDTPPTSMTGTSEEQVSWWGSGQTVLEQEAGSRAGTRRLPGSPRQAQATGAGPRHLGVEPLVRASRANLVGASWGSEDSLSVASDLYAAGLKEPKDHGKGSQGGKIRSRKEPPEQRLELIAHRQAVKREGPGGRGIINCRIYCCL